MFQGNQQHGGLQGQRASAGMPASFQGADAEGTHGQGQPPKQQVLLQKAPQRISSWSQLDGIGGFWSRLPWPGTATPPPAASTADHPQLPANDARQHAPSASGPPPVDLLPSASQHQLQSQHQPAPSKVPIQAAQLDDLAAAPSDTTPAVASGPNERPSSMPPASDPAAAPEDEGASSWYGPFSSYAHWPLPDDVSTGFPHWANVLLGYPPTHDSVSGEMDPREEGDETKHGDAKDRRLVMLQADRTCWTRMKLSVDMINDHLPDTYLEVVQLL